MKFFLLSILMIAVVACDPYGFGFKKNPAYILDAAVKAIQNQDLESFLEITGKEALCLYGDEKGLSYLHQNVQLNPENIDLKLKLNTVKIPKFPEFVGYWSYYSERYVIDLNDKIDGKNLGQMVVDCHYGTAGEKNPNLTVKEVDANDPSAAKKVNKKKFPKKECRLTKIIPKTFSSLSLPGKCEPLKVTVEM